MANRLGTQIQTTLVKGLYTLFMKVTFGASGAPTLVTANGVSQGIKSIARTGAGAYTITFGVPSAATDTYNALLGIGGAAFVGASSGASAPAAPIVAIVDDDVDNGILKVICRNLSGTATDPASGEVLYLPIFLKNSSAI